MKILSFLLELLKTLGWRSETLLESGMYPWWQGALIGTGFYIASGVLYLVFWYVQKSTICECGYPKVKAKTLDKRFKQYTLPEKITLYPLVKNAKCPSLWIWHCFNLNLFTIFAAIVSTVCWLGMVFTIGYGWMMALLLTTPLFVLIVLTVFFAFPASIFVASERYRVWGHSRGKRK